MFSDMKLAQSVLPNIMLPFMLFAGFFANRESMPKWISWLEYVSPMKYYYELVMTNEFEDRGIVPNPVDVMFNFDLGVHKCMLYLLLMSVFLRLVGFFALKGLLKTLE